VGTKVAKEGEKAGRLLETMRPGEKKNIEIEICAKGATEISLT